MQKFEIDLEQVEHELDDTLNLLSIFWGFFNEERPFGDKINELEALLFVNSCKTYESVINVAWDKLRNLHSDVKTAIETHYSKHKKEGGEAA